MTKLACHHTSDGICARCKCVTATAKDLDAAQRRRATTIRTAGRP